MENLTTESNENKPIQPPKYNFWGYVSLFLTQKISLLGSEIVSFSLIWWLSATYDSISVLSIASFMSILPAIILSPIAGVLCDRLNRRNIMFITDFVQACATLGLIIFFSLGYRDLLQIYLLLAIRGAMQGLQLPAGISVMTSMVPPEKLNRMNSLNSLLGSLIAIAGPGLGAIAISLFPIDIIFWLDVVSFIPAAIVILRVAIPSLYHQIVEGIPNQPLKIHFYRDIKEALQYLASSGLYGLILLFTFINVFINPLFSLMPKLFQNVLNANAYQYSFFQIALQVGFILAIFYIMRPSNSVPKIRGLIGAALMTIIANGLVFFVTPSTLWISYILAALIGFTVALIDVQIGTILQLMVPHELLGRVFSSLFTLVKSLLPIGLIVLGFLGDIVGIRWLFLISPAICLGISILLIITTPVLRLKVTQIESQKTEEFPTSNLTNQTDKALEAEIPL